MPLPLLGAIGVKKLILPALVASGLGYGAYANLTKKPEPPTGIPDMRQLLQPQQQQSLPPQQPHPLYTALNEVLTQHAGKMAPAEIKAFFDIITPMVAKIEEQQQRAAIEALRGQQKAEELEFKKWKAAQGGLGVGSSNRALSNQLFGGPVGYVPSLMPLGD